jgi:hypothetical protein
MFGLREAKRLVSQDAHSEFIRNGHCVLSGVANVNKPNSTMSFWTAVFSGPTGADVTGWSMTETKVGTVTYSP